MNEVKLLMKILDWCNRMRETSNENVLSFDENLSITIRLAIVLKRDVFIR